MDEYERFMDLRDAYDFIKTLSEYKNVLEVKDNWYYTSPPLVPLVLERKDGNSVTVCYRPHEARFIYHYFNVPEPTILMRYFN